MIEYHYKISDSVECGYFDIDKVRSVRVRVPSARCLGQRRWSNRQLNEIRVLPYSLVSSDSDNRLVEVLLDKFKLLSNCRRQFFIFT